MTIKIEVPTSVPAFPALSVRKLAEYKAEFDKIKTLQTGREPLLEDIKAIVRYRHAQREVEQLPRWEAKPLAAKKTSTRKKVVAAPVAVSAEDKEAEVAAMKLLAAVGL